MDAETLAKLRNAVRLAEMREKLAPPRPKPLPKPCQKTVQLYRSPKGPEPIPRTAPPEKITVVGLPGWAIRNSAKYYASKAAAAA